MREAREILEAAITIACRLTCRGFVHAVDFPGEEAGLTVNRHG